MLNTKNILETYNWNKINFCEWEYYKFLPNDFKEFPLVYKNLYFFEDLKNYINDICNNLNTKTDLNIKQSFNNKPIRVELNNTDSINRIVNFFENYFQHKSLKSQVTRSYPSDSPIYTNTDQCSKENYWISQFWHIDNLKHFCVGIYLNDVVLGEGDFQFIGQPENNFYNIISSKTKPGYTWKDTRFNDLQPNDNEINSIEGERGFVFFFVPNFIHRGTFPKTTTRDFLRIDFKMR